MAKSRGVTMKSARQGTRAAVAVRMVPQQRMGCFLVECVALHPQLRDTLAPGPRAGVEEVEIAGTILALVGSQTAR